MPPSCTPPPPGTNTTLKTHDVILFFLYQPKPQYYVLWDQHYCSHKTLQNSVLQPLQPSASCHRYQEPLLPEALCAELFCLDYPPTSGNPLPKRRALSPMYHSHPSCPQGRLCSSLLSSHRTPFPLSQHLVHSRILSRTTTVWHIGCLPRWNAEPDKWLIYHWFVSVCRFIAIQFQITFGLISIIRRNIFLSFTLMILFGLCPSPFSSPSPCWSLTPSIKR